MKVAELLGLGLLQKSLSKFKSAKFVKIFLKIFLGITFLCLASCSTHGTFITEHKEAWIDGYSVKSNFADKGLHFCTANVRENGLADPICFRARFEEYEDEAEEVKYKKPKPKSENKEPKE